MYPPTKRGLRVALLLTLGMLITACGPSALEFTIGDCVNIPEGTEISDYESVDCDEAHDAEVFALPQHPDGVDAPFPGADALQTFARDRCLDAFEPYVGIDYNSSAIFYTALTPGEGSWEDADDREVVCLLVGPEEGAGFAQLTGSKRDSGE